MYQCRSHLAGEPVSSVAWAGGRALLVPDGDTRWPSLLLYIYIYIYIKFLYHEQHLMLSNLIVAVVKETVEVLLLLLSLLLMIMMMLDWCLSLLFYSFYFHYQFFFSLLFPLNGNQLAKHQLLCLTSHEYALLSGTPCKMSMYLWEITCSNLFQRSMWDWTLW